ncbi:MAG: IS66 family transposase [Pseudomonadota bacterium]|nr:IS66 family transposase [Pseudomonadota bacterium]
MNREPLESLSKDALIALVLAQAEQIEALARTVATQSARIAGLEAKLDQPPKTPSNSSTPPSKAEKATRPDRPKKRRKNRPGIARQLEENPDRVIEAIAEACPHCGHGLSLEDQPDSHPYDHVDLPPIKPETTRINRHRGTCPCCRQRFSAPVPPGLEPGSPFGPNLQALIIYLHITHAISFERLVRITGELFGVRISEGAIANILQRTAQSLAKAADDIADTVRQAKVVASDETSARVSGKTWWQWVLLCTTAIYHVITDSRAASVITGVLDGAQPEIWVADRYGGQAGHGRERQFCLAHLLRDAQYAVDEGDTDFAPGFKALLLRAMAIGKRRDTLQDATLKRYHAELEKRLDRLLAKRPTNKAAKKLWKAMCRDRADLFRFITRRDVPYTNNGCERALRPSVIFRKVTGCFRSAWGAKTYADAQSVIATARLHGKTALQAIRDTIAPTNTTQAASA